MFQRPRPRSSDSLQLSPVGTGCIGPALWTGPQPALGGSSPPACQVLEQGDCVWMCVLGLPGSLQVWSRGTAGSMGRWLKLPLLPCAGELVLGLSQGLETLCETTQGSRGGRPPAAQPPSPAPRLPLPRLLGLLLGSC